MAQRIHSRRIRVHQNTGNHLFEQTLRFHSSQSVNLNGNQRGHWTVQGLSEKNTLERLGTPDAGTFTITVNGQTTAGIATNATAAVIVAALELLAGIAAGDVVGTGGPLGTAVVQLDWAVNLATQNIAITVDDSLLQDTGDRVAVGAAISDDGGVFTDETADANDAGANDVVLLPAVPVVDDAFYVGHEGKFQQIDHDIGTSGDGTWALAFEYFNTNGIWTPLATFDDNTDLFEAAAGDRTFRFTPPADWAQTTVNAQGPFFYVRARVSAFTAIATQPLGTQIFVYLVENPGVVFPEIDFKTIQAGGTNGGEINPLVGGQDDQLTINQDEAEAPLVKLGSLDHQNSFGIVTGAVVVEAAPAGSEEFTRDIFKKNTFSKANQLVFPAP